MFVVGVIFNGGLPARLDPHQISPNIDQNPRQAYPSPLSVVCWFISNLHTTKLEPKEIFLSLQNFQN